MELGEAIFLLVLGALFIGYGGKNVFKNNGGGSGGKRGGSNSSSSE